MDTMTTQPKVDESTMQDPIRDAMQEQASLEMLGRMVLDGEALEMSPQEVRALVDLKAKQEIRWLILQLAVVQAELAVCRKYGTQRGSSKPALTFNHQADPREIEEAATALADARRATDELRLMERVLCKPAYLPWSELKKLADRLYASSGCRVYVADHTNLIARFTVPEYSVMVHNPEALYRYWKVGHVWMADLDRCSCVEKAELLEVPYVVMKGMATAAMLDAAKTRTYLERDERRNSLRMAQI